MLHESQPRAQPGLRGARADGIRTIIRRAAQSALPNQLLMSRQSSGVPCVYLSFDDGPHPVHTPRLLDALSACHAKASFFVVGEQASKHPGLVRRIVDEGHTLGHHSYYHSDPNLVSAQRLVQEVHRTIRELEAICGMRPCLFRPPRGQLTLPKLLKLWQAGQTVVLWSVDPRDYLMTSKEELVEWVDRRGLSAGDIVLLHDDNPYAADSIDELHRHTQSRRLSLSRIEPRADRGFCDRERLGAL